MFSFADSEVFADELGRLVVAGTKRATASLIWTLEADRKPLPKVGDLSLVTTWAGDPLCVIRTTRLAEVPFDEVTSEFAFEEGEGDRSLGHWREGHWAYFARECERIGRMPERTMPILCEHFEVLQVHPGARRA